MSPVRPTCVRVYRVFLQRHMSTRVRRVCLTCTRTHVLRECVSSVPTLMCREFPVYKDTRTRVSSGPSQCTQTHVFTRSASHMCTRVYVSRVCPTCPRARVSSVTNTQAHTCERLSGVPLVRERLVSLTDSYDRSVNKNRGHFVGERWKARQEGEPR